MKSVSAVSAPSLRRTHPQRRGFRVGLGAASTAALLSLASFAQGAELTEDVERVQTAWVSESQEVLRLRPQFAFAGQDIAVLVPAFWLTTGADCISMAVLSTRTSNFRIDLTQERLGLSKTGAGDSSPKGLHTIAGASMLTRCGPARGELRGAIAVHMNSARGTIEVLLAHGPKAAPNLEALLPERAADPSVRPAPAEAPPPVHALAARIAETLEGISQYGGTVGTRHTLQADSQGRGSVRLRLSEGCHRLVVLSDTEVGGQARPVDLDAELRDPAAGAKVVAADRGFAPDALLEACTGEPREAELVWGGALPTARVVVLEGSWPIATSIPAEWPARARAAVARVLVRRRIALPKEAPVWQGLGVTGRTTLPVRLEPGSCYLLSVGVGAGELQGLRLSSRLGVRQFLDAGSGAFMDGLALSFCVQRPPLALVDVAAGGSNVVWFGALWKTGPMPSGLEDNQ